MKSIGNLTMLASSGSWDPSIGGYQAFDDAPHPLTKGSIPSSAGASLSSALKNSMSLFVSTIVENSCSRKLALHGSISIRISSSFFPRKHNRWTP